jgi:hypothetical protein
MSVCRTPEEKPEMKTVASRTTLELTTALLGVCLLFFIGKPSPAWAQAEDADSQDQELSEPAPPADPQPPAVPQADTPGQQVASEQADPATSQGETDRPSVAPPSDNPSQRFRDDGGQSVLRNQEAAEEVGREQRGRDEDLVPEGESRRQSWQAYAGEPIERESRRFDQDEMDRDYASSSDRNARWRFKRHRGEWWYWSPNERWFYWRDGDWQAYDARTFQPPYRRDSQFYPDQGYVGGDVRYWDDVPGYYYPGRTYYRDRYDYAYPWRPGYGYYGDGRTWSGYRGRPWGYDYDYWYGGRPFYPDRRYYLDSDFRRGANIGGAIGGALGGREGAALGGVIGGEISD